MRILLYAVALVAACKKPAPPPAVDIDAMLHGTRPPEARPLIPAFRATAHDGTPRDQADLLGKPTVMWFFPAANTSGCTVEGCGYRDHYEEFAALGVRIVGVSFTDVETNRAWVESQGFQYEIWRDDDRALALYYDAADDRNQQYPKRRTRVLNADGKVVVEYNDKIIVGAHPDEVLEDVKLLFGNR
ncbi:MAG: peroxiredoxin [Alphaproteobacteria bacterium]|nr:peroxiredoxin [Alphaproteobacteria bacterium]